MIMIMNSNFKYAMHLIDSGKFSLWIYD